MIPQININANLKNGSPTDANLITTQSGTTYGIPATPPASSTITGLNQGTGAIDGLTNAVILSELTSRAYGMGRVNTTSTFSGIEGHRQLLTTVMGIPADRVSAMLYTKADGTYLNSILLKYILVGGGGSGASSSAVLFTSSNNKSVFYNIFQGNAGSNGGSSSLSLSGGYSVTVAGGSGGYGGGYEDDTFSAITSSGLSVDFSYYLEDNLSDYNVYPSAEGTLFGGSVRRDTDTHNGQQHVIATGSAITWQTQNPIANTGAGGNCGLVSIIKRPNGGPVINSNIFRKFRGRNGQNGQPGRVFFGSVGFNPSDTITITIGNGGAGVAGAVGFFDEDTSRVWSQPGSRGADGTSLLWI